MATLHRFSPSPLLSPYIEAFYISEGEAPQHARERRLPDGSMAIVINLGYDTLRVSNEPHVDQLQSFHGGVFSGASSRFSVIDMSVLTSTISVQFKPGGACLFLQMPASELSSQAVDLSTLWGNAATDLREQLQATRTPESKVRILERFLLTHAAWEQTPHPAITFALAQFQTGQERPSISKVTARLGLSPKRFIHLFKETVGLTPKTFCRVLRFQEALRLIKSGQQVKWVDLAVTCGYYDQAHFIHDFQTFAGLTPGAYQTQQGEHHNHVPLPD